MDLLGSISQDTIFLLRSEYYLKHNQPTNHNTYSPNNDKLGEKRTQPALAASTQAQYQTHISEREKEK